MTVDRNIGSTQPTLQTRASMIFRLKDWSDDRTWREFYDLYYNYVYRYARGSGLSHHESEDVTHEVFQRVAINIKKFQPQPQAGSFRRWLGNQARWRVMDKLRENGKNPLAKNQSKFDDFEDRTDSIERVPSIDSDELRLEKEWREQLYDSALQRVAREVNPKHYQVFILHHQEGWSLKQIASSLKISRASVYVINHRLKSMMQKEVLHLSKKLD